MADGFRIVVHVYSLRRRHHLLVRTLVPRERPLLPSATAVYRGAAWHERETYEMFGVVFDGHPDLRPLLLPDGFQGNPLRKDFVLAARVAKPWPGAKEPGESGTGAPSRRRVRPPGVPEDWGPQATAAPTRPERPPRRPRPSTTEPPGGTGRPPRAQGPNAPEPPGGTGRPPRAQGPNAPEPPGGAERPGGPGRPRGPEKPNAPEPPGEAGPSAGIEPPDAAGQSGETGEVGQERRGRRPRGIDGGGDA
jgi:NADH-quinone oxidoreductase subunit C